MGIHKKKGEKEIWFERTGGHRAFWSLLSGSTADARGCWNEKDVSWWYICWCNVMHPIRVISPTGTGKTRRIIARDIKGDLHRQHQFVEHTVRAFAQFVEVVTSSAHLFQLYTLLSLNSYVMSMPKCNHHFCHLQRTSCHFSSVKLCCRQWIRCLVFYDNWQGDPRW